MTCFSTLCRVTVLMVLSLIISSSTDAQGSYGCPIFLDQTNQYETLVAAPRAITGMQYSGVGFQDLDNIYGRDTKVASTVLPSRKSSELLYLSDFGIQVPDGASIIGIQVAVSGSSSLPDELRDTRLSLATGPNQAVGTDKSNLFLGGSAWSGNRWFYGSIMDTWGTTLTASMINAPSFGVLLQVRNISGEAVTVDIDQVAIKVFYQPALVICSHPCIAIQAELDADVVNYAWSVSNELRAEPSNELPNVLNVFAEQSPLGEYQVCLTRTFSNGTTDNCCRPVHYLDCSMTASIGDFIWEDRNANGLQDNGEPGLDGCNVRLYDASRNLLATTLSVDGRYSFTGLEQGRYVVDVEVKDLNPTVINNSNTTTNSDLTSLYLLGSTDIIDLGPGENRTDIDLGLTAYSSICGNVWRDRDGDATRSAIDTNLIALVNLYDENCLLLSTHSVNEDGAYCIDNLAAGNYYIDFTLEAGFVANAYGPNNVIDPITGKIAINLDYKEISEDNDLSAYLVSTIGNQVFADDNENGIQDPGEQGLADVKLNLFSCDNVFFATTTSRADGSYLFQNVAPGSYYICIESAPLGYIPVVPMIMADNFHLQSNGCTGCTTIMDDTHIIDVDYGFAFGTADIGDRIWFDENENGLDDPGELGLADVRVTLQDCTGTTIATQTTDANGNYLFAEVPAGNYVLCVEEDYRQYRIASDLIVSGNCTSCFTHDGRDNDFDFDFELIYEKAIVDTKTWLDENGNGVLDSNEALVEGIRTELYTCDDVLVTSDFTDNIGGAWFDNLCAGEYYVVVYLDDTYDFITNGGSGTISSSTKVGRSECFTVLGFGRTIGVGLMLAEEEQELMLCSGVWNDENESGTLDPGEELLTGMDIWVYSCTGQLVGSIPTSDTGVLCSSAFPEGEYYFLVNLPDGYEPTSNSLITEDNGPGTTACFSLTDSETINLAVKEEVELALPSLDAIVFEDLNGDGLWSAPEPVFTNTTVNVFDCNMNFIASMLTDDNGTVWFQNLPVGEYVVQVNEIDGYNFSTGDITHENGAGTTACFPLNNTGRTVNIILAPDAQSLTADILGIVWFDENQDGFMNNSEPGMEEVMVRLYDDAFNMMEEQLTIEDGSYAFRQRSAGDYYIQFAGPQGYIFTSYQVGNGSDFDSEVLDFQLGMTDKIEFTADSDLAHINAGLMIDESSYSSISGRVWLDANANNIEDVDEGPYQELAVSIYEDNGSFIDLTYTDVNGAYTFDRLLEGSYYLVFDQPTGYEFSDYKAGNDTAVDSDVADVNTGATQTFDLGFGVQLVDVDLGLRAIAQPLSSIAGSVWLDANQNGLIDIGEAGLADIAVTLYDNENNTIASTVTNNEGTYTFTDLDAGMYYVQFSAGILEYSAANVGGISDVDSEVVNGVEGNTSLFELLAGQDLIGVNAGMYEEVVVRSSIEGRVWLDENQDGMIGNDEAGVADISVSLYDNENNTIASTVTNNEGAYTFSDLDAGMYYVQFSAGTYMYSPSKVGGMSDLDSEVVNGVQGSTVLFELEAGQELVGLNAGLYVPAPIVTAITGQVWNDSDQNGLIGPNESSIENINVTLYDNANQNIATVSTDTSGYYEFTGLAAGLYYVEFEAGDYLFTSTRAGGDSDIDSEVVNRLHGRTTLFVLQEGQVLEAVNAGLYIEEILPSSISGQVWSDSNQDGLLGSDEATLADIVVKIFDNTNTELSQTVSAADGSYVFNNLNPGLYYLEFVLEENMSFTAVKAGGDSDNDSEVTNRYNGYTSLYVLGNGQDLEYINAGIYVTPNDPGQLIGTVWMDTDKNGLIDTTEVGIANVTVGLYDNLNVLVEEVSSDDDGNYQFVNVNPGLYYLVFSRPDGLVFTAPKVGGDSNQDSEVVNFNNRNTVLFVLASGEVKSGLNAGYYVPETTPMFASISGSVWEDVNGDGQFSDEETTTENLTIELYNANNEQVAQTTTDVDGSYAFNDLVAGTYTLQFNLPLDTKSTSQYEGTDAALDSDVDPLSNSATVILSGIDQEGVNAGYYYPVSIGDYVWLDFNEDGIQDIDESGANNYLINLFDADGNFVMRSFSTFNIDGSQGSYGFSDLAPGYYYLQVTQQQGVAFSPAANGDVDMDSDISNANGPGTTDLLYLSSGTQLDNIDIGLILSPSTLGNRVWEDSNGDGVQDEDEEGVNGITVQLYNIFETLVAETVTANIGGEDGLYYFEDVYPTEYYVTFSVPDGYQFSPSNMGGVDALDSDIDNSNGIGSTSIFLLSPGEIEEDIDGGIFKTAHIGDFVWHDRNKDGIQDDNEPGVENVEIELYQVSDLGNTLLATTLTNRLGQYRFDNLANGEYYLVFHPTEDFEITTPLVGDVALNSDAEKSGVTGIITIENNTATDDIDVGLIRPSNQIRGYVWDDLNKDGVFSSDEPFMSGVTVWLMDVNGLLMTEMETDFSGVYLFDDIADGDYYVKVIPPVDYTFTIANFGTDDTIDSDIDMDGESEMFSFSGSTVVRNVDIGFVKISKSPTIVYPSPVAGVSLYVKTTVYEDGATVGYKLVDSQGNIVSNQLLDEAARKGETTYEIATGHLNAGNYFLKLEIGRSTESIKFTKVIGM